MIKLILLSATSWAADNAHHANAAGSHEIPWNSIFVQAFNFSVLFGLLFYLLSKSVKAHFAHRAKDYTLLVERAAAAKNEAERGHTEIKSRLDKLESGAEDNLKQARVEAAGLKENLLKEATALSHKLEADAKRSAQIELQKAKDELRHELLENALQASSVTLQTSLSSNEQKRLQAEFVEKIQVVRG